MASDQVVVKEARIQLRKANSWVITALAVEGMEEELGERWREVVDEVDEVLSTWLECER